MQPFGLVIILLFLVAFPTFAVGEKRPGGKPRPVNKKDLPLISCATCQAVAYVLHDFVNQMYTELADANKKSRENNPRFKDKLLSEGEIGEVLDSVCNPDHLNGEWLRHYDIYEERMNPKDSTDLRATLGILWNDEPGVCGSECRTLAYSCHQLLEQDLDDRDDLQTLLYKNKLTPNELLEKLCRKMTKRCNGNIKHNSQRTLAPGYNRIDEKFEIISENDLNMERKLREMQSLGIGATAYNRADLEGMADRGEDSFLPPDYGERSEMVYDMEQELEPEPTDFQSMEEIQAEL